MVEAVELVVEMDRRLHVFVDVECHLCTRELPSSNQHAEEAYIARQVFIVLRDRTARLRRLLPVIYDLVLDDLRRKRRTLQITW